MDNNEITKNEITKNEITKNEITKNDIESMQKWYDLVSSDQMRLGREHEDIYNKIKEIDNFCNSDGCNNDEIKKGLNILNTKIGDSTLGEVMVEMGKDFKKKKSKNESLKDLIVKIVVGSIIVGILGIFSTGVYFTIYKTTQELQKTIINLNQINNKNP
jgi:hypothetical protein